MGDKYTTMSNQDLLKELEMKKNQVRELNRKKMNVESDIIEIKEILLRKDEENKKARNNR
jgi:hypothetical protein